MPAPGNHPLGELLPWALERRNQPLTVEDLARQARMSSRHLARHFKSLTGTSPLQWLHAQRIRHAQELLETTDATVDTWPHEPAPALQNTAAPHPRARHGELSNFRRS
ncbi:hypothetical protein GCM10010326_66080 [Streptomyces xanthochromogenes]|uniref:HTH araC/xylS-type domain-containing protein n=1 Tax=Streptomyces xanthochromogenes TaxID=67384 RepID=A0ABQ3ARV2_9ACTN|nr:hypothetical protein GCM10010326_66080 [Streptomyces xanthochromogenes]